MNEQKSTKLHREMRKLWNRYMAGMHTLRYISRIKLALFVIFVPRKATRYMLALGEKRYGKEVAN